MSDSIDHPASSASETTSPQPAPRPASHRKILRRLTWFGVVVLVGFFAFSIWSALRSGPAVALLRISRQPPAIVFPHLPSSDDGKDFATFGKEQVALVKIRPVLCAALRQPAVSSLPMIANLKDPVGWLQRHLQVSFDNDTGFVRIALRSGPLKARVAIVAAVRDSYLNEVVYKENDNKVRRLAKLREFLSQSEDDLRGKRKHLSEMAKAAGGVNDKSLDARQKLQAGFLQALRQEILENRSSLRKAEVKLALAERKKQPAEVARYQEEVEYLKELGKKLSADFDEANRTVRGSNEKAIDLEFFQKEIDSLDALTKEFRTQKQKLEIEMEAPSRIQALDEPTLEDQRNWQDVLSDLLQSFIW